LITGIGVVTTPQQAQWLNTNVPGANVSRKFIEMLSREGSPNSRKAALRWTADFVSRIRGLPGVSGVLLYAMDHDVESLGELLQLIES